MQIHSTSLSFAILFQLLLFFSYAIALREEWDAVLVVSRLQSLYRMFDTIVEQQQPKKKFVVYVNCCIWSTLRKCLSFKHTRNLFSSWELNNHKSCTRKIVRVYVCVFFLTYYRFSMQFIKLFNFDFTKREKKTIFKKVNKMNEMKYMQTAIK